MLEGLEGRRCIASHADDADYVPPARSLLWKLGYALLPAAEAEAPELRIVREDRLRELGGPELPVILLTGDTSPRTLPPGVIGAIRRPAGMHEIYRLLQSALEAQPRTAPRVATPLTAHARSGDDHYDLQVQSLSENGCLASGAALPPPETELALAIEMPWGERIEVPARASYQEGAQQGLVFHGMKLGTRRQLSKLVVRLLERV